jgi:hypothetical protein
MVDALRDLVRAHNVAPQMQRHCSVCDLAKEGYYRELARGNLKL